MGALLLLLSAARSDVGTALLAAACAHFRAQGLLWAQAWPLKAATTPAKNHLGPLSMYLRAGFEIVREDEDGSVLVQKALA